jgi:hypothetical protein
MLLYPLINQLYKDILERADKISKETKKVFSLSRVLLTLIFYFFIGIPNPENSKAVRRKEIGSIIGISRTPCCKTLRNELNKLTVDDFPEYLNQELRRRYISLVFQPQPLQIFDFLINYHIL